MYNVTVAKWNVNIDEISFRCKEVEIMGNSEGEMSVKIKDIHFDDIRTAMIDLSLLLKKISEGIR